MSHRTAPKLTFSLFFFPPHLNASRRLKMWQIAGGQVAGWRAGRTARSRCLVLHFQTVLDCNTRHPECSYTPPPLLTPALLGNATRKNAHNSCNGHSENVQVLNGDYGTKQE